MFLKGILYLVIVVLILTFVRSVMAMITKAFAELLNPSSGQAGPSRAASTPTGGELKKDPVCGTFIAAATAFQKAAGGQTYYFCSTACRDKFPG